MQPPKFEDYDPFAPTRKRRPFLKAFLGLVVVAGAGVAGGLWWASRTTPQVPALLPADTPVFLSFTPGVSALGGLPLLRRAYPEVFSWQGFQDMRAKLERDLGVSFERDVMPWLGTELGLAYTGSTHLDKLTDKPPADGALVLFLASRDAAKARDCLAKIRKARAARGVAAQPEVRAGLGYDVYNGEVALGQVGSYVVCSLPPAGLENVIDRTVHPPATSLAKHAEYRDLIWKLPGNALGRCYVAGKAMQDLARGFDKLPVLPREAGDFREYALAFRGSASALTLRGDGIAVDAVTRFHTDKLPPGMRADLSLTRKPVAPALLDGLPDEALLAWSFRLPPGFREVVREVARRQVVENPALAKAEREGDFSIERDLAGWVDGEVALGVLPGQDEKVLPVELALAMRPTDPAAARTGLERVRKALQKQLELPGTSKLRELPFGGDWLSRRANQTAPFELRDETRGGAAWHIFHDNRKDADLGGYGLTGNTLYFALGPAAMAATGEQRGRLTDAARFRDAMRGLPRPNGGVFYLDFEGVWERTRTLRPEAGPQLERAIEPLRWLAAAGTPGIDDQGFMRSTVLLGVEEKKP